MPTLLLRGRGLRPCKWWRPGAKDHMSCASSAMHVERGGLRRQEVACGQWGQGCVTARGCGVSSWTDGDVLQWA